MANKFMMDIFWWVAAAMVFFRNDEMISDDAGYIGMIIVMVAGCFVFGGKDD